MRVLAALLTGLCCGSVAMAQHQIIVFVVDGLRPDIISEKATPNLYRLKTEGTWCANSHSVFPTVTRVNSSSLSTGTTPAVHGIVSNTMYVAGVSDKPFDTADYTNLMKLASVSNGRTLAVTTLAETIEKAGKHFVMVSSGSNGSAFLLNPMAPNGVGVLINGGFEGGKRVAWPDKVDQEIRAKYGTQMSDVGVPSLLWTEKVMREYVLGSLKPDVVFDWLTEPDTTQHRTGVGSPESMAVIKTDDEQIGLLMQQVDLKNTDIIVTADHGFAMEPDPVDLNGALQVSGKAGDVIVANNGASSFLYVKNHDRDTIRAVVEQLKKTDGVDLLFTASGAACSPKAEKGWVPGTFALELVDQCRAERGADIVVTYQWNSDETNGFKGSQKIATNDKRQHVTGRAGHGGLNPYMVHTPLILFGPDFRSHSVVEAPTANFDIAPTILKIEGVAAPATMSGRVIGEAFAKGTAKEQKAKPRMVTVRDGAFCSEVQVSNLGTKRYVDWGERCK